MKSGQRTLRVAQIFLGFALGLCQGINAGTNGPAKLPAFSLPDLDGKMWSSANAAMSRKAVVLDFWAAWCTTCKETVPKLVELQEKYGPKGLMIVGISVDKGSAEKVGKNAKKLGINYLVLQDKDNTLAKVFGFNGIPSLYVFDNKGNLTTAMPGYDPDQEKELTQAVVAVLK